jgi:arylsulfatase
MDIMATCVDIGAATYPKSFAGHEILPLEGRSLVPALLDRPVRPRTLVFEHEHNAAIRQDDWKLVGKDILGRDGVKPGGRWQLYNLANDPAEQHDLSSAEPGKVKDLSEAFLSEAHRTLVLPAPR